MPTGAAGGAKSRQEPQPRSSANISRYPDSERVVVRKSPRVSNRQECASVGVSRYTGECSARLGGYSQIPLPSAIS
jgi:hypothetical protein